MLMEKKFLTQMMIHEQGEVCLKGSLNHVLYSKIISFSSW